MLQMVINLLFRCSHPNISRPFTINGSTYKTCLDCGKEIPYDLTIISGEKRTGTPVIEIRPAAADVRYEA